MSRKVSKENLELLSKLLEYSDIYEISIQFWPNQIAVYIEKEGVPLKDFGGDFKATITGATDYLKRINSPHHQKVNDGKDTTPYA